MCACASVFCCINCLRQVLVCVLHVCLSLFILAPSLGVIGWPVRRVYDLVNAVILAHFHR